MLKLLLYMIGVGQLSLVFARGCSESNGQGNKKKLQEPCFFNQLIDIKKWNMNRFIDETNSFFDFGVMHCSSYEMGGDGKVSLDCYHTKLFYIMKNIMSFGTLERTEFFFKFSPQIESDYNGTYVEISGRLSQALANTFLKATKPEGSQEFSILSSARFPEINMEEFINQRKKNGFETLSLENKLVDFPPKLASDAKMSGMFSAIVNSADKQNYEFLISFQGLLREKQYYIFQSVAENINDGVVIAFYKENPSNAGSTVRDIIDQLRGVSFKGNKANTFVVSKDFSPIFEVQTSAMSTSDGEITNINDNGFRIVALKYVSESSPAFILSGVKIYWHVDDPEQLKTSANDVPGVEDPPPPTNETSTVWQEIKMKRNANSKPENPLKRGGLVGKLTLNADIINRNIIEIKSPDYVKGSYEKQLSTFMPYHYWKHDTIKNLLYPVNMEFDKITIGFKRKQLRLYCNISQKFDLVKNLISGDGISVFAKAKLTKAKSVDGSNQKIRFKDIAMAGTTEVLEGLIDVNLQYRKDGTLYVTGMLDIANMTEFINSTGVRHYLPEPYRTRYPRLTNFAITRLQIKSKLNENFLRIIGKCLIFSEPKTNDNLEAENRDGIVDESPDSLKYESKIRVVLTNTSGVVQYSVGIVGTNIPLQVAMRELFNATITGTSWVKFKKFVVVMSNNNEINIAQSIDEKVFNSFRNEIGLQIKTVLLPPMEKDCQMLRKENMDPLSKEALVENEVSGNETVEIRRPPFIKDYTCTFVKDQQLLMENFEYAQGTIEPTSYEIVSKSHTRFLTFQSDPDVAVGMFKYIIKSVYGWDSLFMIQGIFRFRVNEDELFFNGFIVFDDLKGKLVLKLTSLQGGKQWFGNAAKLNSGYSIIGRDGLFTKFHFNASLTVGTVKGKRVHFKKNVEVIYDLGSNDIFMKGARRNFGDDLKGQRNTLIELFEAFGTKATSHVLLKDLKSSSLTWLIYQQKYEEVKLKDGVRRIYKGLNFYGKLVSPNDKQLKFSMRYNEDMGALIGEIDLPPYKLPLKKEAEFHPFRFQRNKEKEEIGGELVVKTTTNYVTVTAVGYLRLPGLEYQVEFIIAPDGKFSMRLPYFRESAKLFSEAEVRYYVEQDVGVTNIKFIDPKIKIDLAPSREKVSRAIQNTIEAMINNVDKYRNSEEFINFVSTVDGETSTMKQVINDISSNIGKIQNTLKQLVQQISSDCAEKCKNSKVFIYGYDFQDGKFVGNEDAHDVANVTCIAECEMIKPIKNDERRGVLDNLKNGLVLFKREKKRADIMQIMLDEHYNGLSTLNTEMKKLGSAAALLISKNENFRNPKFSVASLILEKRISAIKFKGAGTKCLSGFKMTYTYNDELGEKYVNLCFNGEFDQFSADAFINSYYGEDKFSMFNELLNQAADLKESLRRKTEDATTLFKKIADAKTMIELDEVQNEVESTALDFMVNKKSDIKRKKNRNKNAKEGISYITYGDKNVTLPTIDTEILDALEIDQDYSIKSPKSKRVFMYSSPWAALNVLRVHQNKYLQSLPTARSLDSVGYCKQLKKLSSILNTVRSSLSDYAVSYVNAKKNFESLESNMKTGLVQLQIRFSNSNIHDDDKGNLQYWLTQYEKGVSRFSKLSTDKLHDHNNNGLVRWKAEMETSLQNSGIGSIESVIKMLKAGNKRSYSKRANIDHDKWIKDASLMGEEISSLMEKSKMLKMAETDYTIRSIGQKFDNFFAALSKSCKASFMHIA